MRKILVLRGGALGDFIVTLPALAWLRRRWPDARIELVGNATAAQLAVNRGLLDAAHSQHQARWQVLYGDAALPDELTRWLGGFDLVVNFWPDPDGELRQRFPLCAGQVFLHSGAQPVRAPAAAHFLAPLCEAFGGAVGENCHALALPAPDAGLVALHPGSGSPTKNWPLDRWITLATRLECDDGAELLIVTGEADAAAAAAFAGIGMAAHQLTLEQLVQQFARCRVFVGHDSGVSHLAAACGVACVLLFGSTDPAVWAPPAPKVRVLRGETGLSGLSVAEVQREIRRASQTMSPYQSTSKNPRAGDTQAPKLG